MLLVTHASPHPHPNLEEKQWSILCDNNITSKICNFINLDFKKKVFQIVTRNTELLKMNTFQARLAHIFNLSA